MNKKLSKWQKRIGVVLLSLLSSVGVFLFLHDEGIIAEDQLIRFHVIAHSDSVADQDVKLMVRNAVLDYLNPLLMKAQSEAEAYDIVSNQLEALDEIAETVLVKEGFDYKAEVLLGESQFPTKAYGDLVLPAGTYQALKIELGDAMGKNWWCVLFPPLCYVNIGEGIAVATTEHDEIVTDGDVVPADAQPQKTVVKLKILELFE